MAQECQNPAVSAAFGHQFQEILCNWILKLTEFVEGPENELNTMYPEPAFYEQSARQGYWDEDILQGLGVDQKKLLAILHMIEETMAKSSLLGKTFKSALAKSQLNQKLTTVQQSHPEVFRCFPKDQERWVQEVLKKLAWCINNNAKRRVLQRDMQQPTTHLNISSSSEDDNLWPMITCGNATLLTTTLGGYIRVWHQEFEEGPLEFHTKDVESVNRGGIGVQNLLWVDFQHLLMEEFRYKPDTHKVCWVDQKGIEIIVHSDLTLHSAVRRMLEFQSLGLTFKIKSKGTQHLHICTYITNYNGGLDQLAIVRSKDNNTKQAWMPLPVLW